MIETYGHKNIHVRTYAEVQKVSGSIGDFQVEVLQKARFVHEDKCTGCGACMEKCPKKVPSEYEMGLADRRAIYFPFAQAVPRVATVDKDACLHFKTGKCLLCVKECQTGAIDHKMEDQVVTVNVGAIIVTTGFDVYMPDEMEEYGYGRFENVVTAMEFERIINAAGPTHGHLQRLSEDKGRPKRLAFIQCVGARDVRHDRPYCCAVCCMHSTKEAMLAREHYDDIESVIFYKDMRACAKGFFEYVERAKRDYGVRYVNSDATVQENPDTKNPVVVYDVGGRQQSEEFDLVVLATTLVPRKESLEVAKMLGVKADEFGFLESSDHVLDPCRTIIPGVYLAGYAAGPADIPESVAQGSSAAAKAVEALVQTGGA
ncbi:TPA: CoB--CoM heterodisulfide reductase iron-sulfur subunit A family protein [Thermoplasmata archaeon]|nr:CoB--CoM heterodisulfide reductase iron-sulfur subunit A family protein [Thermoplasmata archaeon]